MEVVQSIHGCDGWLPFYARTTWYVYYAEVTSIMRLLLNNSLLSLGKMSWIVFGAYLDEDNCWWGGKSDIVSFASFHNSTSVIAVLMIEQCEVSCFDREDCSSSSKFSSLGRILISHEDLFAFFLWLPHFGSWNCSLNRFLELEKLQTPFSKLHCNFYLIYVILYFFCFLVKPYYIT